MFERKGDIFDQASRIYDENPGLYDENSARDLYLLAEKAKNNLITKGVITAEQAEQRKQDRLNANSSLTSGGYKPEPKTVFTKEQIQTFKNAGLEKKDIDRLANANKHLVNQHDHREQTAKMPMFVEMD